MLLRRFALEQSHLQPLILGPAILEPELHVLRLQTRKLLAIGHLVQLLRVRQNELRTDHKIVFSESPVKWELNIEFPTFSWQWSLFEKNSKQENLNID